MFNYKFKLFTSIPKEIDSLNTSIEGVPLWYISMNPEISENFLKATISPMRCILIECNEQIKHFVIVDKYVLVYSGNKISLVDTNNNTWTIAFYSIQLFHSGKRKLDNIKITEKRLHF